MPARPGPLEVSSGRKDVTQTRRVLSDGRVGPPCLAGPRTRATRWGLSSARPVSHALVSRQPPVPEPDTAPNAPCQHHVAMTTPCPSSLRLDSSSLLVLGPPVTRSRRSPPWRAARHPATFSHIVSHSRPRPCSVGGGGAACGAGLAASPVVSSRVPALTSTPRPRLPPPGGLQSRRLRSQDAPRAGGRFYLSCRAFLHLSYV